MPILTYKSLFFKKLLIKNDMIIQLSELDSYHLKKLGFM